MAGVGRSETHVALLTMSGIAALRSPKNLRKCCVKTGKDRLNLPIGGLRALPGPAPAHLQFEREAQKCPDRHNNGEHP